MKKQLLFITLFTTALAGKAQNLVLNGDFETYSTCPSVYGEINFAVPWINPSSGGGDPDYYNPCSTNTSINVPDNWAGYQTAHSGVAYSGYYIWRADGLREYLEAPLTSTLVANACYHFEMYVNLGNLCQYTTDAIGVYFSNTSITNVNNDTVLPYTAQINNGTGNQFDTLNWTLVNGNYTAAGGENYMLIGNFKNNANTNEVLVSSTGNASAYVFTDDVSLTLMPCTGINTPSFSGGSEYLIYPNPVKEQLIIKNAGLKIKEIKIIDATERIVLEQSNIQSSVFNTQSLNSGIYFIEIYDGKSSSRKKFIKE